jgi:starch synthase
MEPSLLLSPDITAPDRPLHILMASSEAHPLIKTGGLADVAASLPAALRDLGHDARLILPAYPRAARSCASPRRCASSRSRASRTRCASSRASIRITTCRSIWSTRPSTSVAKATPTPTSAGATGATTPSASCCSAGSSPTSARGLPAIGWRPDVLHGNDWQTGWPRPCSGSAGAPGDGLHHPQSRLPGPVRPRHLRSPRPAAHRSGACPAGVPPEDVLHQGRHRVLRPRQHRQPILCHGGANGTLRMRPRRTAAPDRQPLQRHPQRRRLSGLGSRRIPSSCNPMTASLRTQGGEQARPPARVGLPRNEDAFVLGYIGRWWSRKGVDLILAILPHCSRTREPAVVQGPPVSVPPSRPCWTLRGPPAAGRRLHRLRRGPRASHRGRLAMPS